MVNASLTHWMRDKGFGMAGIGRGAPAQIGEHRLPPGERGLAPRALARETSRSGASGGATSGGTWRIVWVLGPMAAMALPVLLAAHLVPFGSNMQGGAGALASPRARSARTETSGSGSPPLLAGLWIFFSTQRGVAEGFTRSVTEILWTGSDRARAWAGERAARLYYAVLGAFAVAGAAALTLGDPLKLVLIGANVGALDS